MPNLYDVVIIGGGPAAVSAAIYAVRAKLRVVMIYKEVGGQMALSGDIDNYAGVPGSNGLQLTEKFAQHLDRYKDVERKEGVTVSRVEKIGELFKTTTNEGVLDSHTVIFATGASPRKLNVPGEDKYYQKGLSYCAVCDGPLFQGKDIAVIGGGNSALDAAQYLAKIGRKILLINKNPVFKGDKVLFESVKTMRNTEIVYNALTKEIVGDGKFANGVKAQTPQGEKTFPVQGVFVAIGRVPATEICAGVEKHAWGEIKTNKNTETNVPGFFAAGDCTDNATKQIIVAAGEGCVAAIKAFEYITKSKMEGY